MGLVPKNQDVRRNKKPNIEAQIKVKNQIVEVQDVQLYSAIIKFYKCKIMLQSMISKKHIIKWH